MARRLIHQIDRIPAIRAATVLIFLWSLAVRGDNSLAQQAEKVFLAARVTYEKQGTNAEAAWKFGRACFDWAEFAEDDKQREKVAGEGIAACRQAVGRQPRSVEGHYYLAMNLGQLARTKTLGALKLVDEMETEFKIARDLDENFDFAGPNRNLGLLYFEAPGWPTSIGNQSKARHYLERAVKLSPKYPENHLNLLEAYRKWGEKKGTQRELSSMKELWVVARKEFSGEQWEASWVDWEKRWKKMQATAGKPPKDSTAPRQKN